jgi:subtilisin family serine protease
MDEVEVTEILSLDAATVDLARRGSVDGFAPTADVAGFRAAHTVIVARMSPQQASALQRQAGTQLVVEPDAMLTLSTLDLRSCDPEIHDPGVAAPHAAGLTATFAVTGTDGTPLQGATVHLFGRIWSAQGTTGPDGLVSLTVYGEAPDSLTALYVRPRSNYWSFWVRNPAIRPNATHAIELTPLSRSFPAFPERQMLGWGQKAMGLDHLPAGWRGRGVKIAIVDSGVAAKHRDLRGIRAGIDTVDRKHGDWSIDETGHGSLCAGIIAGLDNDSGIRGFAPEAEIHVCRMFPGGRFSDLIRALDYAISHQIDVINLALGSPTASEIVERRVTLAKQLGIACVVAAGNSGGAVEYPASSTQAFAVAAMGRAKEYPSDSYHALQSLDGAQGALTGGLFCARFSSHGPEVDAIAPGIAIVSSVPPDDFVASDGTSLATAHVSGLAALLLAHHPDFAGPYRARGAARVERLFQILKATANRLSIGDPDYCGAGLPDAIRAFNLDLPGSAEIEAPAERVNRLFGAEAVGSLTIGDLPGDRRPPDMPNGLVPDWLGPRGVRRGPAVTGIGPLTRMPIATNGAAPDITIEGLRREMQQAALL